MYSITEIMVNGPDEVFIERNGKLNNRACASTINISNIIDPNHCSTRP